MSDNLDLPYWELDEDDQIAASTCLDCGSNLQLVRPGKWQCDKCDMDAMIEKAEHDAAKKMQSACLFAARRAITAEEWDISGHWYLSDQWWAITKAVRALSPEGQIDDAMTKKQFDEICEKVRVDERQRCAHAVCLYCAGKEDYNLVQRAEKINGEWQHRVKSGGTFRCDAEGIWQLK